VDPRVYPGLTGLSADSNPGEEGVNYLRRLRGEGVDGGPASKMDTGGGKAPSAGIVVDWTERRQSPRLRCSGSVEFRTDGSDVRMWGTLTDVSLHGCYVEMHSTFPADTKIDLVLKSFGIRIEVSGTVRASYPFLGMGIRFTGIAREQQLRLQQLLDALAGQRGVSKGIPASPNVVTDGFGSTDLRSTDSRAVLEHLVDFFKKNRTLSRDEFHQIAKQLRRS
jgi:PilZ domain